MRWIIILLLAAAALASLVASDYCRKTARHQTTAGALDTYQMWSFVCIIAFVLSSGGLFIYVISSSPGLGSLAP